MSLEAAFAALGLGPDADVAAVEAAWRRLRSELHPDRPDGDAERFDAGRRAYELARAHAAAPRRCLTCDGLGKLHQQRGFHVMSRACPACRGTGRV